MTRTVIGRIGRSLKTHRVILLALIIIMIALAFLHPNFLTSGNLLDIVRVVSINGIIAVGMTMILLTSGIDLSVGSIFALCGAIAVSMVENAYSDYPTSSLIKLPVLAAVLIGLAAGAIIGLVNGLMVTGLKIEPFIATLAMMSFARGLTYLYTGGYPINFKPMPQEFAWLGQGYVSGVPAPTLFFIICIAAGGFLLRYTPFGRSLFAVGGNREAALLSGIDVNKSVCLTYVLTGLLSALAGIIMASRVASASPVSGKGLEMDVIAGVVIGGTLQSGGRGSILGTLIGVFIFGVIENGLNIMGVPTYYKLIIKGLVLIIALGPGALPRKKRRVKEASQ